MPDLHSLLLFVSAGLLLNVTPGPDVLYILGRSLSQGRVAGVVSALGISTGCLFHVATTAFGLSGIVLALPRIYNLIRLAGALYLVWLGFQAFRSSSDKLEVTTSRQVSLGAIFRQGMLTNMLNPKVALFL